MNIINKTIPVALIIAMTSISSPVGAQSVDIPMRGPMPFAAFDTDGNGFVSEKEFNAAHGQRMAARAAEGRSMRGAASAPSFSAFDTNSDGQLTESELTAGRKAQMEKRRDMSMGQGMGMGPGYGRGMGMWPGYGRGMGMGPGYGQGMGMGPGYGRGMGPGYGQGMGMGPGYGPGMGVNERAQQGYQMRGPGNAPSFTDIDANGDGAISPDEFNAHQAQRRQQRAR